MVSQNLAKAFGAIVIKREGLIMWKLLPAALVMSICSACATSPDAKSADVANVNEVEFGLPAQELESGECGLFLWNRTDARTFVFFQRAGEASALHHSDGDVQLTNTANDGVLFGPFYSRSMWEFPDGRTLRLSIEPGDEIEGGQRIPNGVISSQNS